MASDKINPEQRYYNIIRKIEVDTAGDVTFYMTGMESPLTVDDFISRTKSRKRLTEIEKLITEHNKRELERFKKRGKWQL